MPQHGPAATSAGHRTCKPNGSRRRPHALMLIGGICKPNRDLPSILRRSVLSNVGGASSGLLPRLWSAIATDDVVEDSTKMQTAISEKQNQQSAALPRRDFDQAWEKYPNLAGTVTCKGGYAGNAAQTVTCKGEYIVFARKDQGLLLPTCLLNIARSLMGNSPSHGALSVSRCSNAIVFEKRAADGVWTSGRPTEAIRIIKVPVGRNTDGCLVIAFLSKLRNSICQGRKTIFSKTFCIDKQHNVTQ